MRYPSFLRLKMMKEEQRALWDVVYDLARDQVEGREVNKVLAGAVNGEYLEVLRSIAFMEGNMTETKHLEGIARGLTERSLAERKR